ncbi:MAG TPA: hypothetical protein P5080_04835 [Candidatus Paceibacterota bacterium]|nr:hypothetical protein [Candidatus Pacearchaeota archaeon]HRZ51277.1 hypothetical protein [Candidatus Paceibacterota bacterium]HSA36999.1 hypothetical protein [Candidatus Paceibacterota bacterium]
MKKTLFLTSIIVVLGIISGSDALTSSSYRANQASTVTVDEWSECRLVTNQPAAKDTFVPTNTALEWSEFRIHYPSHISLDACNRTLAVAMAGTGAGTVTSSPAGIDCGTTCSATFNISDTVTLTATPAVGSTFTGWSGGDCSGTGACTVTLANDTDVTATFTVNIYKLTVIKSGNGSGVVSSGPAGIDCGATCLATYAHGTSITLTNNDDVGSLITGWSGGGCSGTTPCVFTITGDTTVTATFTLTNFTLTVTKSGFGTGTVTSNPAGINCGTDCLEIYPAHAPVTLTASPGAGSVFARWSGACTGGNNCVIKMDSDLSVNAYFSYPDCKVTPPGGKRIFTTSWRGMYKGNEVRTYAIADNYCQTLATDAGLPGTYKALIYLGGRLPETVLPLGFAFYNGEDNGSYCDWHLVANSRADMWVLPLKSSIQYDEFGHDTAVIYVWTNFKSHGDGTYETIDYCDSVDTDPCPTSSWPCTLAVIKFSGLSRWANCVQSYYGYSEKTNVEWSGKLWWAQNAWSTKYPGCVWPSIMDHCNALIKGLYCVQQ